MFSRRFGKLPRNFYFLKAQAPVISSPASISSSISSPTPSMTWKPVKRMEGVGTGLKAFADLSKFKLSSLVLLTTASGYLMAMGLGEQHLPLHQLPSSGNFLITMAGTALCSFSANSFNQWLEAPLDSQMNRTRVRPLPRLVLTPFAAFNWAIGSGLLGIGMLAGSGVNWLAAALAGSTIFLYAAIYTPLKRISHWNTWMGAVVGALPPLIGWTALTGSVFSNPASLILPGFLFAWQFPHFMSLSWNLRTEYARAGYHMASLVKPDLCRRAALRYALLLVPLTCIAGPLGVGLTTSAFMFSGNVVNAALIWRSWRFWKNPSKETARSLFFTSLVHLPLLLLLLFLHRETTSLETPEKYIEGREKGRQLSDSTAT